MAQHRRSRQPALSCPEVVELLSDWLEGDLDADTSDRVQVHLAHCEGCTTYVSQLRATIGTLAALPAPSTYELREDLVQAFRDWAG